MNTETDLGRANSRMRAEALLFSSAKKFWPELESIGGMERAAGVADVMGFLYAVPFALLGLVWLVAVTDLDAVAGAWTLCAILAGLVLLFERVRFFVYIDVQGLFVSAEGSLSSVATWSGALLLGPTVLWLAVLAPLIEFAYKWPRESSTAARWERLRGLALRAASVIPSGLLALALYERWGGTYPLPSLAPEAILPALYATLVQTALAILTYTPFVLYVGRRAAQLTENASSLRSFLRAATVALFLPAMAAPFAVLAAGLYAQNGLLLYLFFVGAVLLGSLLAHQLSQAVERSHQRSRELEKLEQLGQALISARPDATALPQLLQDHVPSMFPSSRIEIRRFPDQVLVRFPDTEDWPQVPAAVWDWLRSSSQAHFFMPDCVPPWGHRPAGQPLVVAPILDQETTEPVGGVYVVPQRDPVSTSSLLPAVQSLAAQVASALHSAQVYTQTLDIQKVEQELSLAGQIQARFLPDVLPEVPGWQLAVSLEPARRTSGDFYDVIPLPNGRLGIVIADVADKGMGAALYMALSRTLIRTYAFEHHTRPDFALRVANNRILADTQTELFVTVFYGVLDPLTGKLSYCNAGHNPPYLFQPDADKVQKLDRTGLPLGIFRGQTWEHRTVQLTPGGVLVLYTDGVTEAQNRAEDFFGEERLLAAAQAQRGRPADEIRAALMGAVHEFVGDAPRYDDIALMVIAREA